MFVFQFSIGRTLGRSYVICVPPANTGDDTEALVTVLLLHGVEKDVPTSASCGFDKHRLIWITVGKQHRHTFKTFLISSLLLILLRPAQGALSDDAV